MASPDELRSAIEQARSAFRAAVEGAGSKWEQTPGGEEWSPRQIAEHAVSGEYTFSRSAAETMQSRVPGAKEFSFATPQDALAASAEAAEESSRVVRYIEQNDLQKSASVADNLEGLLNLTASHLNDHAQQVSSA